MTTLAQNASDSDNVIVVTPGSEQENGFHFRVDDEILAFLGYDRDSTADILEYLDGDRTRWRVRRGQEGTTAAAHLSGATLYAVVPAWSTGADLTDPDPFAPNAAPPTLADVLAEGNDPDGRSIAGASDVDAIGGSIAVTPGASGTGGNAQIVGGDSTGTDGIGGRLLLSSGNGDVGAGGFPAAINLYGVGEGGAGQSGLIDIQTDGSTGNVGEVIVGGSGVQSGYAVWGRLPNSAELVITEDASGAAGTYTGSITVPGGATITGIGVTPIADWSSNIAVTIQIGVEGELGRYLEDGPGGFTLGTTTWDTGDGLGSFSNSGVGWYSDTDNELLVTVTVSDTNPPGTGIVRVLVTWSLPPSSAATFEAAA